MKQISQQKLSGNCNKTNNLRMLSLHNVNHPSFLLQRNCSYVEKHSCPDYLFHKNSGCGFQNIHDKIVIMEKMWRSSGQLYSCFKIVILIIIPYKQEN